MTKKNKTNPTKKIAIAVENASAESFDLLKKRKFNPPTEKAIPQFKPKERWFVWANTKQEEANRADDSGDYSEVVRLYTELIESNGFQNLRKKDQAATYNKRGTAYRRQDKFDLAIADYNKVIELNPDAQTYTDLGNVYADKGRSLNEHDQTACFTKAMSFFCTAIEKKPNFEDAYRNLGLFLTEHRDHKTGKYQHNLTTDQRKNVEDGLKTNKILRLGVVYLFSYLAESYRDEDEQKKNDWSDEAKTFFKNVLFNPQILGNKNIDKPNKLYRFKPFNERVFDELKNQKLFLNDPTQWNDPFDGRMFANFRVPEYQHYFKRLRMQSFCVKRSEEDQVFPTDPLNNFLMWSHYADQHQGVCLMYEYQPPPQQAQETPRVFLHPARYRNEPDFLHLAKYNNGPDLKDAHDFYLTKSEQWRYENEYRLVHMIEEGDDAKLKEPCLLDYKDIGLTLTSICFGSECSETRIEMIKAFIKETNREDKISLKQATNDGLRFKLEHKEI
jgi:tetratricopeptide (TPR) repeat protein